jgi:CDP-diacylglycerol--glycerol-3-phosphate 3-phosphatidyltransferase/cardiolipin synthase
LNKRLNYRLKKAIPSLISIIRIFLAPFFLITFLDNYLVLSLLIYVLAVATDAIDGYLARILDTSTSSGAYLDITADLILVLAGFSAFIITGIYPIWILLIILLMFLQFIITSKAKKPVYDPVGKYYGAFLFLIIFVTLINLILIDNQFLNFIFFVSTVIFTIIAVISRLFFIIPSNKLRE